MSHLWSLASLLLTIIKVNALLRRIGIAVSVTDFGSRSSRTGAVSVRMTGMTKQQTGVLRILMSVGETRTRGGTRISGGEIRMTGEERRMNAEGNLMTIVETHMTDTETKTTYIAAAATGPRMIGHEIRRVDIEQRMPRDPETRMTAEETQRIDIGVQMTDIGGPRTVAQMTAGVYQLIEKKLMTGRIEGEKSRNEQTDTQGKIVVKII